MISAERASEALHLAETVAAAMEANLTFGAIHPRTLRVRSLRTALLGELGRCDEALAEIETVIAAQQSHASIGPGHPDVQESVERSNRIRRRCGGSEQAAQ